MPVDTRKLVVLVEAVDVVVGSTHEATLVLFGIVVDVVAKRLLLLLLLGSGVCASHQSCSSSSSALVVGRRCGCAGRSGVDGRGGGSVSGQTVLCALTSEDVKAVVTNSRRSRSSRSCKNSRSESLVAPVRLVVAQSADAGFALETESGNAVEASRQCAEPTFLLGDVGGLGERERLRCGAPFDDRLDERCEYGCFAGPRQFSSESGNSLFAVADPNNGKV